MSISWRAERTRRICIDAMLLGVALMLSYIENLLPLGAVLPLPGFRLGLANLVVLLAFCLHSSVDAALISATRILIMGILFGSVTSLYFSALGGLCSFLTLILLSRVGRGCSFLGVSVLCAAAHNCGQIIAAATLFGSSLITSYLPLLLIASVVYGGIVGALLNLCIPRLKPIMKGGRA